MCGIVYGKRADQLPIFKAIFKRYKNQEKRGTQGFGYIAIEDGKVKGVKRFTTENEVEKALQEEKSSEILFHHRYPTSTPNISDLNHPITIKDKSFKKNYYFIHNGVILNDDELYEKHQKLGFEYETYLTTTTIHKTKNQQEKKSTYCFNDSEALGYEVALLLEGKQDSIKADGNIAFICIQTNKHNKIEAIHYGRNSGNPLVIERDDKNSLFFLKSEGGGTSILSNVLYTTDYNTQETHERDLLVGSKDEPVESSYSSMGYDTNGYQLPDRATSRSKYNKNMYSDSMFEDDINYEEMAEELWEDEYQRNGAEIEYLEDKFGELEDDELSSEETIAYYKAEIENPDVSELNREGFEDLLEIEEDRIIDIRKKKSKVEERIDFLYTYDSDCIDGEFDKNVIDV